jgi:hypothetical protein
METKGVVFGCRNDGYKEDERIITCLTSMIETFDEVLFCDWGSPSDKGPILWKLQNEIPKTGKIKHFVIPEEVVKEITKENAHINPYAFILAQNILLRRCTSDWITSTAMDIIAPKKEYLDNFISKADKNTFYTISRRDIEYESLEKAGYKNWRQFRDELDKTTQPRYFPAKVTPNDDYSLINSCGDFQTAHRDVWLNLKGFEEQMLYACFGDTNMQKKAVLKGYNLEAYYDLPLYHLSHKNMVPQNGNLDTLHENGKKTQLLYNDPWTWVEWFTESQNTEAWGFGDTEIEFEII